MSLKHVLILSLLLVVILGGAAPRLLADDRPNILFIFTDDQSNRTVGCYENSYDWVRTPNIDGLAADGVRFTHAYIGTWCMPSRATMLTGLHQYGVESMRMEGPYPGSTYDPELCPFWPKTFRENGYFTGHIGKWHTGTDTGRDRDWDHQIVWNRPANPSNSGKYYYDQLITFPDGETRKVDGYSTDNYTDWAIDFLEGESRPDDQPWYLWLCYGAVHGPRTPAERHLEDYPGVEVPMPKDIFPGRPGKPDHVDQWRQYGQRPDTEDGLDKVQRQLNGETQKDSRCVRAIDENIGRLLAALDESGQRENTLIVYTSDQGFAFGQHGMRMKQAPYDATLTAPLIASYPGVIPEGEVCRTAVGGHDIIPTFFHFANIETPWDMHGRDVSGLMREPETESDHPVLMIFTNRIYGQATRNIPEPDEFQKYPWWVSYRQGRYKYIRHLIADEIEELYDLDADPEELTNLALDASHAALVKEFRDATIEELRRTECPYVDIMPTVR